MRRPRIADCHAAALELERIARTSTRHTQVERQRAEMCERMAEWLGALAREMDQQIRRHKQNGWPLPARAPMMKVPK